MAVENPLVALWDRKNGAWTRTAGGVFVRGWTDNSSAVRTTPTIVAAMVGPDASSFVTLSVRKPATILRGVGRPGQPVAYAETELGGGCLVEGDLVEGRVSGQATVDHDRPVDGAGSIRRPGSP